MSAPPIDDSSITMDQEGFLTDPQAWTPVIAESIAADEGIDLTDRHWLVINFMRDEFARTGVTPSLRRVTQQSGVSTKELYALFPKGPGKKVARIAGLKKPEGCV